MNLFQIDKQIEELVEYGFNNECFDFETGEIDTEKAERFLADLQVEREVKLDNYGKYVKNLEAQAKALKEEEDKFKQRRQRIERKAEWFKKAIVSSLMLNGDKKFESVNVVLSTTKSHKVEVDAEMLDKRFMREKVEYTPDKTAIKEAIKNGEEVVGAWMVTNINLTVK
jgi:hypothetical protein